MATVKVHKEHPVPSGQEDELSGLRGDLTFQLIGLGGWPITRPRNQPSGRRNAPRKVSLL